jgi:hypothetical protein
VEGEVAQVPPDPESPVLYYLSRNRLLEHPHFMEVPLSSTDGLYLRGYQTPTVSVTQTNNQWRRAAAGAAGGDGLL